MMRHLVAFVLLLCLVYVTVGVHEEDDDDDDDESDMLDQKWDFDFVMDNVPEPQELNDFYTRSEKIDPTYSDVINSNFDLCYMVKNKDDTNHEDYSDRLIEPFELAHVKVARTQTIGEFNETRIVYSIHATEVMRELVGRIHRFREDTLAQNPSAVFPLPSQVEALEFTKSLIYVGEGHYDRFWAHIINAQQLRHGHFSRVWLSPTAIYISKALQARANKIAGGPGKDYPKNYESGEIVIFIQRKTQTAESAYYLEAALIQKLHSQILNLSHGKLNLAMNYMREPEAQSKFFSGPALDFLASSVIHTSFSKMHSEMVIFNREYFEKFHGTQPLPSYSKRARIRYIFDELFHILPVRFGQKNKRAMCMIPFQSADFLLNDGHRGSLVSIYEIIADRYFQDVHYYKRYKALILTPIFEAVKRNEPTARYTSFNSLENVVHSFYDITYDLVSHMEEEEKVAKCGVVCHRIGRHAMYMALTQLDFQLLMALYLENPAVMTTTEDMRPKMNLQIDNVRAARLARMATSGKMDSNWFDEPEDEQEDNGSEQETVQLEPSQLEVADLDFDIKEEKENECAPSEN